MKHFLAFLLSFVFSVSVLAQEREGTVSPAAASIRGAASAPSGSCSPASTGAVGVRIYGGAFYYCNSGTWAAMSGGGGTTINSTNGQLPYRVNSTTFGDSAIASNALNSTYLSLTSGASGAGVTVAVAGGGTNELLTISSKGTARITFNIPGADDFYFSNVNGTTVIRPNSRLGLGALQVITWNHNADGSSTGDIGLSRLAGGQLRITNASTGAGQLIVGTSTDTVSAQLDVRSQSATRPAGRFQAASTALATQINIENRDGSGTLQGGFYVSGVVLTGVFTVATLPSAATVGQGSRAFVTDANTTIILGLGTTVVGGGANSVPVYSDGTNWIIG